MHYEIVQAVTGQSQQKLFFVNGPGGTGKSFTWNTITHSLHALGKIVLCVASSGIAALILIGGRTAHSTLAIPVPTHESTTCWIKKGADLAALIQQTSLIIWDEAPMQHKHVMETVDHTLRGIKDELDLLFGGVPIAWGGDFQQTLPAVPRGKREYIVGACLQKSYLWRHINILHLTENMQVDLTDPQSVEFAQWLLDIGSGKDLPLNHKIPIPPHMLSPSTVKELISEIYPGISQGNRLSSQYYLKRAILAPRNAEVTELNSSILDSFPGDLQTFHSVDRVGDIGDETGNQGSGEGQHYPVEYLNSFELRSLPPSKLQLKPGVPLMLLCNLDPSEGLCNGTRLRLKGATGRVLNVEILTGPKAGENAFIPRITISASEGALLFILFWRQFPVRLAFAMTINKSQGQSLGTVGIGLHSPVFSHGQLYVAVSRGTNWGRIKVLLAEGAARKTENIVYPDILLPT